MPRFLRPWPAERRDSVAVMDEDVASAPEWAAEYLVDAPLAAGLIGAQFPSLRGAQVEALATGWDNTVFLVGRHWVFRFPRRAVAVPGLSREIAVLPRLAPRLPLPVPVPEFAGAPSGGYPWPFWGARLLPGHELAESQLPDAAREAAAAGVGSFLRALHSPALAAAFGPGLQVDPLRRGDVGLRAACARERLDRLVRRRIWVPGGAAERLLAGAERLSQAGPGNIAPPGSGPPGGGPPGGGPPGGGPSGGGPSGGGPSGGGPPGGGRPGSAAKTAASVGSPVVSHGDLHVRHLLVNDDGRPTGVIDFGDLCLADPGVDLSLAYGGFAGRARAALLAAYGPVSPAQQMLARVLAVFLCAALADYAAAQARPRLLREALAGLSRATAG